MNDRDFILIHIFYPIIYWQKAGQPLQEIQWFNQYFIDEYGI